jgi:hypothetical protein
MQKDCSIVKEQIFHNVDPLCKHRFLNSLDAGTDPPQLISDPEHLNVANIL